MVQETPDPVQIEPSPQEPQRKLPYSGWWPLWIGAAFGIVMRLLFSADAGESFSPMAGAFIFCVPLAVGAVTVYVAELQSRRSWSYYFVAAALANALFVLGTMAILIEGAICAILIMPLFAVVGGLGGLGMGAICRKSQWRKPTLYSLGALPLLLAGMPWPNADTRHLGVVERSIVVPAPAPAVWQQLHDTRDIQPHEVDQAWMYRIGVPVPISGVTQTTPTGHVRHIRMGKSIHFEQIATDWVENRYVRWTYRFTPDSFPPRALDDHVVIGGHYFDLIDTSYTLVPRNDQTTELHIRMHYRVNTQFNWYAQTVAELLIGNFGDVILQFYLHRAVQAGVLPTS